MNELVIAIFGMIVTGLGSVVYNKPKTGRILVLLAVLLFAFAYIYFDRYWQGKLEGIIASEEIISKNPKMPFTESSINIRNFVQHSSDTSNKDILENYEKYLDTIKIQAAQYFEEIEIRKKILEKEQIDAKEIVKLRERLAILKWASLSAAFILFGLTYILKDNSKGNKKKKKNKSPQTSRSEVY